MNSKRTLTLAAAGLIAISLYGCQASVGLGAAAAAVQQQPEVTAYSSGKAPTSVHTAAVQAMAEFGSLSLSDKDSGIVQGKRGNWLMNVSIKGAGKGSRIEISPRYVPSKQMDLNSKSTLVADYTALLEKALQEKLALVAK